MNIFIFTKTLWSETPRIRHQLSNLLASKGHNIFFFEKPSNVFTKISINMPEKNITTIRLPELLHHQLKIEKLTTKFSNFLFTKIRRSFSDTS